MSLTTPDEKASVSVDLESTPVVDVPTPPARDQYGDNYVQSKGVNNIEALRAAAKTSKSGRRMLWVVGACLWIASFAYAIQSSTSFNYSVWATSSFENHSAGLAALNVATSIISSVSQPFIAKFADLWGRPGSYLLGIVLYMMGYIIISQSPTLASYIVGNVFATLGGAVVNFMNWVIVSDLTDLQWRGFCNSLLSVPYLITPWFTANIVAKLGTSNNWRWGYGMYAIILPISTLPIVGALFFLSLQAKKQKLGIRVTADATEEAGVEKTSPAPSVSPWQRAKDIFIELDAVGLILLGFGWSLFLLPFSLEGAAKNNWNNPSMIAMMIVGVLCLIAYGVYEMSFAPIPSFPRRILFNKTFMMCIAIDFIYEFAGDLNLTYMSSYTYIVSDWSLQGWTYFSNTSTLAFCSVAVLAGILQRIMHRYKVLQVGGLCIAVLGYGLLLSPHGKTATTSTVLLAASSTLVGIGSAFSVTASQVAAQASVPHQDMTLVMALLGLWSAVGGSVGSAIASVIWAAQMPRNLRTYLPASVNDTQVAAFYDDITLVRAYAFDDPIRQGAIEAYRHTLWGLFVAALVASIAAVGAAYFQTDYFLGTRHNAVMNIGPDGTPVAEEEKESERDTSQMGWSRRLVYRVFAI